MVIGEHSTRGSSHTDDPPVKLACEASNLRTSQENQFQLLTIQKLYLGEIQRQMWAQGNILTSSSREPDWEVVVHQIEREGFIVWRLLQIFIAQIWQLTIQIG